MLNSQVKQRLAEVGTADAFQVVQVLPLDLLPCPAAHWRQSALGGVDSAAHSTVPSGGVVNGFSGCCNSGAQQEAVVQETHGSGARSHHLAETQLPCGLHDVAQQWCQRTLGECL